MRWKNDGSYGENGGKHMNKISVFFDIKIIIDNFFAKGTNRSGIYFVAWNVLNVMQKNENINITLAYPVEYKGSVSLKKIRQHPFFSQFEFACTGVGAELEMLIKHRIKRYREKKIYIKMIYNYLCLLKLKRKEKLCYNKEHFRNAEIYLSPYNAISQKILEQEHIKKIYILYDIIPIKISEYFGSLSFNLILNTLNKNTYSFCISQSCKDDFLNYCGDKLDANKMFVTHIATNQHYIPNYNKQELLKILKKYGVEHSICDKYLFSLCSLEPRKNLPFTISCFLKFIKKHSIQDLYFYLGGGAWKSFKSVMAKILEEAGEFRHKIKLLGYIEDSDLNMLYSSSLFFTYLSQYEGFGMPPLEAMQAGTPVITSNNSSLPEVVGDAAISLTYNDEGAVIKAFEDFYFNENLRKEYIAKGLERAKMFSWEKCVQQMICSIEEMGRC
jgi:glycosyltransferase involved in cell wall biosynthesis